MITHLKEFTLPRDVWLRGESDSYLLRARDDKMCCFGVYLLACGYKKEDLVQLYEPSELNIEIKNITHKGGNFNTPECENIMEENDDGYITEEKRECLIIKGFKKIGIKVNIVDTIKE